MRLDRSVRTLFKRNALLWDRVEANRVGLIVSLFDLHGCRTHEKIKRRFIELRVEVRAIQVIKD